MDRLSIGMRAEYVAEWADRLKHAAQDAIDSGKGEGKPRIFEFEFEAFDNDTSGQVIVTVNNDDMERDEVKRDLVIVEAD